MGKLGKHHADRAALSPHQAAASMATRAVLLFPLEAFLLCIRQFFFSLSHTGDSQTQQLGHHLG